jgi:Uma2 family endonuclease
MSPVVSPDAPELPDIDDRLVEPETRYEMYDGELVYVSPAAPPHGERHLQLAALIEAHTGSRFEAAADLLTRTSEIDDVAPDVSVYPEAPDFGTGGRQLEQLAFEIVSKQSLGNAGRKAAKLARRGVRRVFAVDVERGRALEWSAELGAWRELDATSRIEDPALEVPLPVHDIIHAAKADDAVQRALIAKGNPVLKAHVDRNREDADAQGHARGKAEGIHEGVVRGKAEGIHEGVVRGRAESVHEGFVRGKTEGIHEGVVRGKAEAVLTVLAVRGIAVGDAARVRIAGELDPGQLDRWLARAATCTDVAELFTMPSFP